MGGWRGGAWRLPLVVVALLTWLAGCGGDATITGPPGFVAGYPRIERVGALTFVVAIRLDVPGAVDLVAASTSEYPGCGECFEAMGVQCVDSCFGQCLVACLMAQNATNATTAPKPYFRRTIELPNPGRETRVLIRGAYNLQRPDLSGAYGDFVVYPNTTYSVAVAPRNSSAYLNQPGDDDTAVVHVTTAAAVSSDASLARLGSTNSTALTPAFDNSSSPSTWSYETSVADDVDAAPETRARSRAASPTAMATSHPSPSSLSLSSFSSSSERGTTALGRAEEEEVFPDDDPPSPSFLPTATPPRWTIVADVDAPCDPHERRDWSISAVVRTDLTHGGVHETDLVTAFLAAPPRPCGRDRNLDPSLEAAAEDRDDVSFEDDEDAGVSSADDDEDGLLCREARVVVPVPAEKSRRKSPAFRVKMWGV